MDKAGKGYIRPVYTPEKITSLQPGEIFVFGSNLQGLHAGGAARIAGEKFGAVWGQGVGLQGRSYAIPTMQGGVETIRPYVDEFIAFAKAHRELTFLVTPIGCGIAGFDVEDIAPLFKEAMTVDNIVLPESFEKVIVGSPNGKEKSTEGSCLLNYTDIQESLRKEDLYNIPNLDYLFFWGHHGNPGKITKACLSQWYPCEFMADGEIYNCTEQFMMAEKARIMGDKAAEEKILTSTEPRGIKALGREVKNFDENKWNRLRMKVVIKGNFHKFMDNKELRKFLLNTGNKILVEASPYDTIWGIGMKEDNPDCRNPRLWKGDNLLGFALIYVREMLNN